MTVIYEKINRNFTINSQQGLQRACKPTINVRTNTGSSQFRSFNEFFIFTLILVKRKHKLKIFTRQNEDFKNDFQNEMKLFSCSKDSGVLLGNVLYL